MILPIATLPAAVLRRPVEPINFPLAKDHLRLLKNMVQTVKQANGVGLAAPQVGQNLNAALVYLEEARLPGLPILNPRLVESSPETEEMEEGCLSLPGVFGLVARPKKITMTAYGVDGKEFTVTDDGFLARVLQHEIDHLNNILIVDKFIRVTQGAELLPNYAES